MKVSIIIPVYNEEATIEEVIHRVKGVDLDKEIIVVDDCSTDFTRQILDNSNGIKLVSTASNQGKGTSIRAGLEQATGDIIVIQDADMEYFPEDIPALIEPIVSGRADVVYGSRFLSNHPFMRWQNYLANKLLAVTASVLYNRRVSDEATCYKAFRAETLRSIKLTCKRFEFCPEVTAKLLKRKVRYEEVSIRYHARSLTQGKKIRAWDGVIALWTLLKYRFIG